MSASPDLLDQALIRRCLVKELSESHRDSLLNDVEVLASVASTSSYLLNNEIPVGRGCVCLAEEQTAGRGRRGNTWQAAPQKNLIVSLSWGFESCPAAISALGLAVGLTVAERLNADYSLDIGIKWPNDLLVGGHKLAGILVDAVAGKGSVFNVVIGLGLNVNQADFIRDAEVSYSMTDLRSNGVVESRNVLAGVIAADLLVMLSNYEREGFAPLAERWNALSSYSGQEVVLLDQVNGRSSGLGVITGVMEGVDVSGQLLVRKDGGKIEAVNSSRYSLRRAQDEKING